MINFVFDRFGPMGNNVTKKDQPKALVNGNLCMGYERHITNFWIVNDSFQHTYLLELLCISLSRFGCIRLFFCDQTCSMQ